MGVRQPSLFLLILLLFFTSYSSYAQEYYSYTHYDISDGLAGSSAYCMAQDKEGFMWIGTETGLSRFDGTHFVSYTTADGLPDMEVLQMMCDSKDRVWMALFHPSVCYSYKGKIHNAANDSLLRKIHLTTNIESMAEDGQGNVLLQEHYALHLIKTNNEVMDIRQVNGRPISTFFAVGGGKHDHFLVLVGQDVYKLTSDGHFTFQYHAPHFGLNVTGIAMDDATVLWKADMFWAYVRTDTSRISKRPFDSGHFKHMTFSLIGDSLLYDNQSSGVREENLHTGFQRNYLPGIQVNRSFRDDEGSLWFATMGHGIYRLNSNEIRNVILVDTQSRRCAAIYINKVNGELLIGTTNELIFSGHLNDGNLETNMIFHYSYAGYTTFADRTPWGDLVYGSQDHMGLGKKVPYKIQVPTQVKVAVRKNADQLIVGNSQGVFVVDIKTLEIQDTLWRERCSALALQDDRLYIGTLNGLHILEGKTHRFPGDSIPFLKKRISAVAVPKDGGIWAASYDAGVIGVLPGKSPVYLTTRQNLSSNICRTLTINGDNLWVGTDKGLNRVDLSSPEYAVTHYTAKDGLASDMINTVYVDDQMVYVGTPEGLSYFDATHTSVATGCRLALLGINSSGKERLADTFSLLLPYKENNIRFDFAGISYKSAGNITYRYRLIGLDSTWKNTKETFLEYPTLPYGDYELQLQAINKFGVQSPVRSIVFSVDTPFWRTAWFVALLVISFLTLTWGFLTLRIKAIRKQQTEKEQQNKRLAELEHVALQAQMNPHFIFNCLNSIQQYVFEQDVLAANKYITGFARLIRATLQHSTKAYIPLSDEIDYLSTYLSLEKLRFKEKMNYSINVDPSVERTEFLYIPPMIIQPYVENSMRHGLRHRSGPGGYIRIEISQKGGMLVFVIEDNGIGREKAASYKTREHIEYQSRGMSLTADRIRLMNSVNEEEITVEIIDLQNTRGQASGTRVIVKFPKFDLNHQEVLI